MVPLVLSLAAFAQDVLVLDHLDGPAEDAWIEELTLGLPDAFRRVPMASLADTPIHEQLDRVRPMLEQDQVAALAWLNEDRASLHLSVAFVAADRAVVRMVDVPNDADAPARLALATREILTQAIDLPAAPPPAPSPAVAEAPEPRLARLQLTIGGTVPVEVLAGGPRVGADVEITQPIGPIALGASVGSQVNGNHWRLTPRAVGRVGPFFAAGGADITQLEWVSWAQPRIELGLTLDLPVVVEGRVRFTPLRDEVRRGEVLYDSGWVELGLHLGIARQIRRR